MDHVHVIRHKALVEGQSIRSAAYQMQVSRNTVRKYLKESEPRRKETGSMFSLSIEEALWEAATLTKKGNDGLPSTDELASLPRVCAAAYPLVRIPLPTRAGNIVLAGWHWRRSRALTTSTPRIRSRISTDQRPSPRGDQASNDTTKSSTLLAPLARSNPSLRAHDWVRSSSTCRLSRSRWRSNP